MTTYVGSIPSEMARPYRDGVGQGDRLAALFVRLRLRRPRSTRTVWNDS